MTFNQHLFVLLAYIIFGGLFAFIGGKGVTINRHYYQPNQRAVAFMKDGTEKVITTGRNLNIDFYTLSDKYVIRGVSTGASRALATINDPNIITVVIQDIPGVE